MPPNLKYDKEAVLNSAYDLVLEEGMAALSARNVADRLGSSVAPVYSTFDSMEKLEIAVVRRIKNFLITYIKEIKSETTFLNIGIGIVFFARDFTNLYRSLFVDGNKYRSILDELLIELSQMTPDDPRLAPLSTESRYKLLYSLWIFIHGHASLICSQLHDNQSDEFFISSIREVSETLLEKSLESQPE